LEQKVSLKNKLINNIKNIPGWKSNRKLLAFAVDDYGNIRLASADAKEKLLKNGVNLKGRFDQLDALDTREDYEHLFEVLASVKDKNNRSAVFTTYAMPCNIDFDKTLEKGEFVYEFLDQTYQKAIASDASAYAGAYELMQQGIKSGLIMPQFHGREHINVHLFNALLRDQHPHLLANLEKRSIAGLPSHPNFPDVSYNAAFTFWDKQEIELHKVIITDGLQAFEKVYGFFPITFTASARPPHPDLFEFINKLGVKSIDKLRFDKYHLGNGKYVKGYNSLGKKKNEQYVTVVRNCFFEPNSKNINWVDYTYKQIEAAFFWKTPAIISSHRVNFCGYIDPKNRENGLDNLKRLLHKVVKHHPDVEFVGMDELVLEIIDSKI
jgi:hypothetical protein